MVEQHRATPRFWQTYNALPEEVRSRARKQFALLQKNSHYPSLQFKKLTEKHGEVWWSARVTNDYRALAIRRPEGFFWFWIGSHKVYDGLIS